MESKILIGFKGFASHWSGVTKLLTPDWVIIILCYFLLNIWLPTAIAEENLDVKTYSLTNSPLLINPQGFQGNNQLFVKAHVRFVNDCYADAGVDVTYIDLPVYGSKDVQRLLILKQKINPEGCYDIYHPVVRPFKIFSKALPTINNFMLIDHVIGTDRKLIPPPVSLQVTRQGNIPCDTDEETAQEAFPPKGSTGKIPELSAAHITSINIDDLVRYTFEAKVPVSKGKTVGEAFSVWRFETRFGVEEHLESQITDWLFLLPKFQEKSGTTLESKVFHIEIEGAKGAARRLGIVNPLSSILHIEQRGKPFTFLDVI